MSAPAEVRRTYDLVAPEYARCFLHELDHKLLDRALLDSFVTMTVGHGRALDVGCGPGHVAAYLSARRGQAAGLDLSPEMVALARTHHPGLEFEAGDMLELGERGLAGSVAFYSIVHLPQEDLARVAGSFHGALAPGAGCCCRSTSAPRWCTSTSGGTRRCRSTAISTSSRWRKPYPEEHPTRRAYVLARR